MKSDPLISIVIPTYNRADLIGKTIKSALEQDYSDYEIIVIDDGSTDETESVLSAYSNEIIYRKVENGERGRARNIGVSESKGEYVYFLDSDDLLYPQHLRTAVEMIRNSEPEILWLPYEIVDEEGNSLKTYSASKEDTLDRLVSEGNFMSCHGLFIRRSILVEHPFNETRSLAGSEDMELWIRLASRYPFLQGSEVTSCLVEHGDRSVMNFNDIDKLTTRKSLMVSLLKEDPVVSERLKGQFLILESSADSYVALHCMMNRNTPSRVAWNYFLRSLKKHPVSLISKRSLAIVKHGFLRMFSN